MPLLIVFWSALLLDAGGHCQNKLMIEQANDRMDRTDGRTDGRTKERTNGQIRRTKERTKYKSNLSRNHAKTYTQNTRELQWKIEKETISYHMLQFIVKIVRGKTKMIMNIRFPSMHRRICHRRQ